MLSERARGGREMGEKLSGTDILSVIQAAQTIGKTFTWRTSKKGQEYWEDVFNELMRIVASGEP